VKAKEIKTNEAGYVEFAKRNWSYRGDKGTWVKAEKLESGKTLISVKYASKGTVTEAYTDEIDDFLKSLGVNFYLYEVNCGDTRTVEI